MRVALTGATGFIGRYIACHLSDQGNSSRRWHRPTSDRAGFAEIIDLEWIGRELGVSDSTPVAVARP